MKRPKREADEPLGGDAPASSSGNGQAPGQPTKSARPAAVRRTWFGLGRPAVTARPQPPDEDAQLAELEAALTSARKRFEEAEARAEEARQRFAEAEWKLGQTERRRQISARWQDALRAALYENDQIDLNLKRAHLQERLSAWSNEGHQALAAIDQLAEEIRQPSDGSG